MLLTYLINYLLDRLTRDSQKLVCQTADITIASTESGKFTVCLLYLTTCDKSPLVYLSAIFSSGIGLIRAA